jgi:hypothetical protein
VQAQLLVIETQYEVAVFL